MPQQAVSTTDSHDNTKSSQHYWNTFSTHYEKINATITIQATKIMHDHLQLSSATSILEVACASGIGTDDLLSRCAAPSNSVSPQVTVHATDMSPVMVTKATNHLASHSHMSQLTITQADACDLTQFATSSIDRYVSGLCLHLVPNPVRMLQEAVRVLRPGGYAGFTITGTPENSGLLTLINQTLALLDDHASKDLANAPKASNHKSIEHGNYKLSRDMPALCAMFKAAGFTTMVHWPVWCVQRPVMEPATYVTTLLPALDGNQLHNEAPERTAQKKKLCLELASEWIATGKPIALETFVIIAQK